MCIRREGGEAYFYDTVRSPALNTAIFLFSFFASTNLAFSFLSFRLLACKDKFCSLALCRSHTQKSTISIQCLITSKTPKFSPISSPNKQKTMRRLILLTLLTLAAPLTLAKKSPLLPRQGSDAFIPETTPVIECQYPCGEECVYPSKGDTCCAEGCKWGYIGTRWLGGGARSWLPTITAATITRSGPTKLRCMVTDRIAIL